MKMKTPKLSCVWKAVAIAFLLDSLIIPATANLSNSKVLPSMGARAEQVQTIHSSIEASVRISSSGVIVDTNYPLKGINYGWNKLDGSWINTWLSTKWNETKVRSDFVEMQKMGVSLVRVFSGFEQCINWTPGVDGGYSGFNRYISNVDSLFEIARKNDVQIILNIHFAEASFHWDSLFNIDGKLLRPNLRESYLNMMRDLALRYKDETGLYAFDLFNEVYSLIDLNPDQTGCIGGSPSENNVTVEIMHDYLRDSYQTIKKADPNRLVTFEVTANHQSSPVGTFYKYRQLIEDCVDYYQVGAYNNNGILAEDLLPDLDQVDKPVILGECGASEFWLPAINAEALQKFWDEAKALGIKAVLPWSFVEDNIIDSITHEWKEGAFTIQNWPNGN